MAGTFILRPTAISSGGTPIANGSGGLPVDYKGWTTIDYPTTTLLDAFLQLVDLVFTQCACFSDVSPNSYDDVCRLSFVGASIYLDGSPTPIAIAALPGGFTPSAATVKISIDSIAQPNDGSTHYHLQQDALTEGTIDTDTFPYVFSPPPSIVKILGDACGLHTEIICNDGTDVGELVNVCDFRIEGIYDIIAFTWALSSPPNPAEAGDTITVTGDDGLDGIETLEIQYKQGDTIHTITVTDIVTQTPTSLVFILPAGFAPTDGLLYIVGIGDGIEFSGSVVLGILHTILFVNASGIYSLVLGKTSDTLYDNDNPGSTIDVKIPDPTFKTGFIGG